MLNFEVASCSSFRNIQKDHFVTAEAAADIDDSIKRKRILFSIKKLQRQNDHIAIVTRKEVPCQ